jgi:hypothetical protein
MTHDDLDRILSSEDPLEPSSHFAMSVMDVVRRSQAEPPPLQFPWLRFVAGVGASAVMAAAGTVLLLPSGPALTAVAASFAPLAAVAPELGYATAAVLLGLGLASVPRLLAGLPKAHA